MENFSQNSKNSEPKEVPLSSASLYYLNNIQSSQEDLRRKSQLSTNNNENFSLAVQNIDNIHPLHNQQLVFNEFPSVSNNLFADQSRVENSFFDRDGISLDLSPPNRQSFKNSNNFQNSPYGHNIYNPVVANNYNYPNSTLKLDSTNPFSPISCKYEYTFDNNSKAFLDESFKLFNHSSPASSRIFDSTDNFLRPVLTKENILGSACDRTFQQSSLFKSPTGFSSNDFESGNRSVFQEMRDSQKMKWVTNQNGNAELLKTSWSCADVPSFNKPDLTMISRVKSRPQACATITSIPEEEEEGKIDETLIVKLCPNLEKMSSQTSISLDLSYKSKIVLKTPTKLIQNYYEVQQSINWDKEVQNMILTQNPSMVMEENFDYIEFKLRQSKVLPDHITVGRQNVVIDPIADADEDEDTIMVFVNIIFSCRKIYQ